MAEEFLGHRVGSLAEVVGRWHVPHKGRLHVEAQLTAFAGSGIDDLLALVLAHQPPQLRKATAKLHRVCHTCRTTLHELCSGHPPSHHVSLAC